MYLDLYANVDNEHIDHRCAVSQYHLLLHLREINIRRVLTIKDNEGFFTRLGGRDDNTFQNRLWNAPRDDDVPMAATTPVRRRRGRDTAPAAHLTLDERAARPRCSPHRGGHAL